MALTTIEQALVVTTEAAASSTDAIIRPFSGTLHACAGSVVVQHFDSKPSLAIRFNPEKAVVSLDKLES